MKHLDFTVVDLLMLECAYAFAFGLRFSWDHPFHHEIYGQIGWILALVSLCASYFTDAYHGVLQRDAWAEFKACFGKLSVVMLVVFGYFFATQRGVWYSRLALGGTAVFSVLFTWIGRSVWKLWLFHMRRRDPNLPNLLVIEPMKEAADFIRSFSGTQYKAFHICGVIPLNLQGDEAFVEGVPVVADASHYLDFVRTNVVDEVFLDADGDDALAYAVTDDMLKMGVTVHTNINNRANENANTFIERIGNYSVLTTGVSVASVAELLAKRAIDILGALVGLLICGVAFVFVAPGIWLSSPGPIIFKQERIGRHNKPFRMYKFRSMRVNDSETTGWSTNQDNRKTPFGAFIRKYSLDEFPQFFNVLKGDMSLVGPRPELPHFVNKFREEIPLYMVKHQVRPGITGWAQVNDLRGDTSIADRIEYDIHYIETWTPGLDIKILLMTVFKGKFKNDEQLTP